MKVHETYHDNVNSPYAGAFREHSASRRFTSLWAKLFNILLQWALTEFQIAATSNHRIQDNLVKGGRGNNCRCLSSFCTGLLNPAALIVTGTSTISELKANKKLQDRITGKHPRPSRVIGGTWMSRERNTNISFKHRRCRRILSFIY